MKSQLHILGLAAICLSAPLIARGGCGVDWTVPSNHFNGVNEQGYVSYWEKVGEVDFGLQNGEGLELPLIIGFRSDFETVSPYLGKGWILSLLESWIVQVEENRFLMTQPDGWQRWFWRNKPSETVLKGQGGWMAEIKAGNVISAWADCGWRMDYLKGKITVITTPKGRKLEFSYNGAVAVAIRENGVTKIAVELDQATAEAKALLFNGRRIEIDRDKRPRVQSIGGQNVIGAMDVSLKRLKASASPSDRFEFSVNEKVEPTLKIISKRGGERLITWDPQTRRITADGEWKYQIKQGADALANAEIGRTNPSGQRELWFRDDSKGSEISLTADGVKTVCSTFAGGLLRGRLRKIVVTNPGEDAKLLKSYSYDEMGNIIVEIKDGNEFRHLWNENRSEKTTLKNGKHFSRSKYDGDRRIIQYDQVGYGRQTFEYPDRGYRKVTTIPETRRTDTGAHALNAALTTVRMELNGKVVDEWLPDGRHFHYEYDRFTGHVAKVFRDGRPLFEYIKCAGELVKIAVENSEQ